MRSRKAFFVLIAAAIVMVAAAVLVSQRSANGPISTRGPHLPGLASRLDAVRTVEVRTAESELRLERGDAGWVARNKDDYPANAGRIRQLALGLSRLERLERKTDNPERLSRLDLRSVDEQGSRAVRVTLRNADDEALADVLVGKTQDFQQAGRSRYFIRDAGDPQSWLVEGSLPPVLEETRNWLDTALLPGVEENALRSITVRHADGEVLTVRREAPADTDFVVAGLADDEKVDSQYPVNAVAQALRRLSLSDVRAAGDGLDEELAVVEASTFDGVRITARIGAPDPDYDIRLRAVYPADDDRAAGEDAARGGEDLAGELNRRWRGRSFIVSRHALDSLLVRRDDLVTPAGEDTE